MLDLVTHPAYDIPLPARHRFPATKFSRLMTVMKRDGMLNGFTQHQPKPASQADLMAVHCPHYINQVASGTLPEEALRVLGLKWSDVLRNRSFLAPNGTLETARLALTSGLACHAAGGTHHAHYAYGAGYCVFNDLAYAARRLVDEGAARQVLIFDCDVHQGDGTARMLSGDDRIFTCSLHCRTNYPARRAVSDLDIEIEKGTGDDGYLAVLADTLAALSGPLASKHYGLRPDLVLYDAGVDVHNDDKLGHLKLSYDGIRLRDEMVIRHFRDQGCAVATVIGGGYGTDIDEVAMRHSLIFRAALAVENEAG